MSGMTKRMKGFLSGRVKRSGLRAPIAGGEKPAQPMQPAGSQMAAGPMQDERKSRMGRNRNTIMQDKFGG